MASRSLPQRKPRHAYHHGNLRAALIEQAVRTIRTRGVEALTLREVGAALRVSRTALYRHFADKTALLAAVAAEGFRAFSAALVAAWEGGGRGVAGFEAMGLAYIRFATTNPAHYRVMFGGFVAGGEVDPDLTAEARASFQVLVDALVELQQQGLVRKEDPLPQARYVWAVVHGVATLAIDGMLPAHGAQLDAFAALAVERIRTGIDR